MTTFQDSVQVKGYLEIEVFENGVLAPQHCREGKNIWTVSGREYLARLTSYDGSSTPYRDDRIRYIGVGAGASPQVASVIRLADPQAFEPSQFLAPIALPPEFPTPTSVRYSRFFATDEISLLGTVRISEFGLFTDGDPGDSFTPGSRKTALTDAADQEPVAYKTVDSFPKSNQISFWARWTISYS